ncbi:hypothetical protein GGR52DRAFT_407975 [Hypoxylon sp. FL1284]|nr:hypothetical protein GGR52DRAFT_407975 [Hypoxylon sp. FL1284]
MGLSYRTIVSISTVHVCASVAQAVTKDADSLDHTFRSTAEGMRLDVQARYVGDRMQAHAPGRLVFCSMLKRARTCRNARQVEIQYDRRRESNDSRASCKTGSSRVYFLAIMFLSGDTIRI